MALKLPEQRKLNPVQLPEKPAVPVEKIVEVLGYNPLAKGVDTFAQALAVALDNRAKRKVNRQANEAVVRAFGQQIEPETQTIPEKTRIDFQGADLALPSLSLRDTAKSQFAMPAKELTPLPEGQEFAQPQQSVYAGKTLPQVEVPTGRQKVVSEGMYPWLNQIDVNMPNEVVMKMIDDASRQSTAYTWDADKNQFVPVTNVVGGLRQFNQPKETSSVGSALDERNRLSGVRIETGIVGRYNADTDVKKAQQMLTAARTIRDLVNSNNPIASASIPTFSARMAGEVGNLSEADKEPFGTTKQINQKIESYFTEKATGVISKENLSFMRDLTGVIEKRAIETQNLLARKWAGQYAQIPGIGKNEEQIYQLLTGNSKTKLNPLPSKSKEDLVREFNEKLGRTK